MPANPPARPDDVTLREMSVERLQQRIYNGIDQLRGFSPPVVVNLDDLMAAVNELCARDARRASDARAPELEPDVAKQLAVALVDSVTPYEALLVDGESKKWIAPEIWQHIENSVAKARLAVLRYDAALRASPPSESPAAPAIPATDWRAGAKAVCVRCLNPVSVQPTDDDRLCLTRLCGCTDASFYLIVPNKTARGPAPEDGT